jgi:alpha,alpha-trehalase
MCSCRAAAAEFLALVVLSPPIASTQPAPAPLSGYPEPSQALFKELFVAVQTAAIYTDSEVFADSVPKAALDVILAQYRALQPDSPLALREFVDAHFALPTAASAPP